MPIPRIAIVGRPNVGKSSLLNMLAGDKVSIVDPTPGVTRDRVSVVVDLDDPSGGPPRSVQITDTGGFGVYTADDRRYDEVGNDLSELRKDVEFQIGEAVANADLILFCIDAQAGVTPQDLDIARLLRERRFGRRPDPGPATSADRPATPAPIHVVATKTDGPRWEAHAFELASLGFGEPMICSARNNYFRRELLDRLFTLLPPPEAGEAPPPAADLRLAIIGKRNAGKSSLVNALAGEPRVIVSEIPGTTRDAVDVRFELDGRTLIAIDTAGLRRTRSFQDRVEWWAFDRAQRAIDRADAVILLIDATEPVSRVDEQLAMLVQKACKPVVIAVSKWDLAEGRHDDQGRPATPGAYDDYLRKALRGLAFAPVVCFSAETGLNVRELVRVAFDLHNQASQRVTTGRLNRLVRSIVDRRGPPSASGRLAKVYYTAQIAANPPTIVLVVNEPTLFTPNYKRFLLNRFREELPFAEVPIRLAVRARKPADQHRPDDHRAAVPGPAPGFDSDETLDAAPVSADELSAQPGDFFEDDE